MAVPQSGQTMVARRQPRIFYGWWIVLAGTVIMALMGAFSYYGFGVFFNPIVEHFGWSATALALALSLARLEGGIMAPIMGYLIDRLGPRKLMLVGILASGTGYLLLSQTSSMVYFYIVFILLVQGGASAGMGNAPMTAVANWFQRRRATAMGVMNLGISIGGLMARPLADFITVFGWRWALAMAGITIWVVGIPLALVVRHRPEQYGYLPDGRSPEPVHAVEGAASDVAVPSGPKDNQGDEYKEIDFSPKQAMKTMAFWSIAFMFSARHLVTGSVALFLIPLLQERGMSLSSAAGVVSLMALLGMPGRVGFAWLGDHFDKRLVIAFCFIFQTVGLILFTAIGGNLGITFFLILYAPTYSGVLPLIPAIQGEYFGRRWFATIRGFMAPVGTVSLVGGPLLVGSIHDFSGSYEPAFFVLAVANVLALVFIVITRKPKDPAFASA